MGQLVAKLWSVFRGARSGRILMLGLDGAGKTAALYRMKLGEVVSPGPTIGVNTETVQFGKIEFTIWDVGGQDKIRQIWRYYFQGTQGLVFVVDSNDTERIDMAATELKYLLSQDSLRGAALLVLANKQDLPHAMSVSDMERKLELQQAVGQRLWRVQPCCVITGDGLFEGFDWLAAHI